jgi:glycoprotease/Kae1 family metallohydrolase
LKRYPGLRPVGDDQTKNLTFLGIESSCDDSCASILSLSFDPLRVTVETDIRISQNEVHRDYGGVVPHLAKRAHASILPNVIERALKHNNNTTAIDAIFVTTGPGLSGSLFAGVREAIRVGRRMNVPVYGVNHLEAHVMTSELLRNDANIDINSVFPFLTLVVSGGNTFISRTRDVGNHTILASTRDDALGEALDKAARMLEIEGGGAGLEKWARESNASDRAASNPLPIPNRRSRAASLLKAQGRGGNGVTIDGSSTAFFSFSGLKSALHRHLLSHPVDDDDNAITTKRNLAYFFQDAAFTHVVDVVNRCVSTVASSSSSSSPPKSLVVSGGVASSRTMREKLEEGLRETGVGGVRAPPPHWCVDNAVMIAWTGMLRMGAGIQGEDLTRRSRPTVASHPPSQEEEEDDVAVRGLIRPKWPLSDVV